VENGVRLSRVFRGLVGVDAAVVEDVEFDELEALVVVHVRVPARLRGRCGVCAVRCPGYDRGRRRRWRALDLGQLQAVVEADAPRVRCPEHGVVVAAVPWARHGAGHTRAFDEQVAWLATVCAKSTVVELMRVAWRTVGAVVTRVWDEVEAGHDRFAGLSRIGIDEISYKRGHRYLTVVVDHDSGRLVWAAAGRDKATLRRFFDALGEARSGQITHVSADAAGYIAEVVAERCPAAVRCADPFHVVAWATDALDQVRRDVWNRLRRPTRGRRHTNATGPGKAIKNARWALWKNPENLTTRQHAKLAWIAKAEPTLHRAYLLKEGIRLVFQLPAEEAEAALDSWLGWARRSRIPAFVDLQRRVTAQRAPILASIEHGLSNARVEAMNTRIRLITRMAFGFHTPAALIALAMLTLGGYRPALPGRN
jgi:transposase